MDAPAIMWIAAAVWFSLGCATTLEGVDEGGLVYTSWRFAEGALPYRDLHHNYGPSVFVVNAALFRLFGAELLPIRLSLVGVKATLAIGIISDADARALVDESRAVATLEAHRPLVVRAGPPALWAGLERAFPTLVHTLRTRYREHGRVGPYTILVPRDGGG